MTLWVNGNTGGVPEQLIIRDSGTAASTNMALLVGIFIILIQIHIHHFNLYWLELVTNLYY